MGLVIAGGITAVMGVGVAMVRPEFTFYSIMPESSPQVRDMKTIVETFPAASSIIVVVQARDGTDPQQSRDLVIEAVDAIQAELERPEYSEYVESVRGRMEMEFFRNHGLMLTEADDIRRLGPMYAGLELVPFFRSLNDDLEAEYSGDEESLSDDEALIAGRFEGLAYILELLESAARGVAIPQSEVDKVTEEFLFGSGYLLNRDGTMALLIVQPTFTVNDIGPLMTGVPLLEDAIQREAEKIGVTVGLTGFTVVAKDEGVTAEQGLAASSALALGLILVLMILTFRMFSAPLISGIPLVIGVVWTIGIAGFVLGRLNIMTAMYLVALLGLGIDYAIHLLTTFVQERDSGAQFVDAVAESFRKSGSGILLGALTTAVAFFALLVAKSDMVRELGVMAGAGVLCELLAMFILVPTLLAWQEHRNVRRGRGESKLLARFSPGATLLPKLGKAVNRSPLPFAAACLIAGGVLSTQALKVEVEGNIMNMEAKGLDSVELQDLMVSEFGMAPDFLSVTTTDLDELRRLADEIDALPAVKSTDSIAPYLPSDAETAERAAEIDRLRAQMRATEVGGVVDAVTLADEIDRLWFNIVELADLAYIGEMDRLFDALNAIVGLDADGQKIAERSIDRLPDLLLLAAARASSGAGQALSVFQVQLGGAFKSTLLKMSDGEAITVEMLPQQVRDSYISSDGTRYLLNAFPRGNAWEIGFRSIYTAQLQTVTDKATGMLLSADQMVQIAEVDGVRAAIAALSVIFLLLLIDFRNLKLTIATLLPLVLSFGSLFGIMALVGIKFDFINIIAVPLLIGMGVDDAVHIGHRYLYEGPGKMATVVAKTGTAVLLTSVTTIIAFASFIPSIMRAMRSTGIVLSLAMALAFIFSVLFYPAILVLVREKLNLKIEPWGKR